MDGLFGSTLPVLERALGARARNHALLAGNVANIETPGYVPREVNFQKAMQGALAKQGHLAATAPGHLQPAASSGHGAYIERRGVTPGGDANRVELEEETSRMALNQLMYDAGIQLAGKKLQSISAAIKEGR